MEYWIIAGILFISFFCRTIIVRVHYYTDTSLPDWFHLGFGIYFVEFICVGIFFYLLFKLVRSQIFPKKEGTEQLQSSQNLRAVPLLDEEEEEEEL